MKIYLVPANTQDLALQALLADFIVERLHDAGKTAIAFIENDVAVVKTNACQVVFDDACLEGGIRLEAFLRVYEPQLSAPKMVKAA